MIAGPMELFLVEEAAVLYGAWVWLMMLVAYGLIVLLLVLLLRPRLVVYNITPEQLRPWWPKSRRGWMPIASGQAKASPCRRLGVQLHLEAAPLLKNVQLVSSGADQSLAGWRQLQVTLRRKLAPRGTGTNPLGVSLLGFGVLLVIVITVLLARDPAGTLQAANEMLRR